MIPEKGGILTELSWSVCSQYRNSPLQKPTQSRSCGGISCELPWPRPTPDCSKPWLTLALWPLVFSKVYPLLTQILCYERPTEPRFLHVVGGEVVVKPDTARPPHQQLRLGISSLASAFSVWWCEFAFLSPVSYHCRALAIPQECGTRLLQLQKR